MHPMTAEQGLSDIALTEVFATKGQVRLLRFLATEVKGPVTAKEVADGTGMTDSTARRALERLSRMGLVGATEVADTIGYILHRDGPLVEEIVRLFHLEQEVRFSNGKSQCVQKATTGGTGAGRGLGKAHGKEKAKGNGAGSNGNGRTDGVGPLAGNRDPDPSSPEYCGALVSLLEEDLSLIRRARENVLRKLENREPGNGHDLWEWRKVLDTYPLPRLLHFLESDSPRARRLRKSSPFPDVMSEAERDRLSGYTERAH